MIDARLVDGDHASCFVLAVRANVTHGLPLSLADRKAAALDIIRLYPHWSDRMIASLSGLAGRTVAGLRGCLTEKNRQLDSRIGRDGRIRPSDIVERRRAAADLIARQPGASLREIARQAGISPETAREVRRQVNQGRGSGSRAFPAAVPPPPDRPASADRADPPQASMMLAALRGDPALRSSERGRLLLRMLGAAEVLPKHSEQIIDAVPAHSIKRVAEASRACAQAWEWFAAYAERKAAAIRSTG
jgi:transposase-like protein